MSSEPFEPEPREVIWVETVRGPVASSDLGMTLTHEHLICDWTRPPEHDGDVPDAHDVGRVDASVRWLLQDDPGLMPDNMRHDDVRLIVDELSTFVAAGGRTIVDCTNAGIGRDPLALRRISEVSGVHVVMGAGWYLEPFLEPSRLQDPVDALAETILVEFAHGVGETGAKPGIIGEIGVSPLFTEAERRRLRAAARAQREVGVPLFVHLPGWQRRAHEVLQILLEEECVHPEAIVLCHMDPSGDDREYQRAVADTGVWLEFDMIGMPYYFPGEGQSPAPDQTAAAIAALLSSGRTRVLLSHDTSSKMMLTRHGGNGFAYIPRLFLPRLERHGVDAAMARSLLTAHPARVFDAARRQSRNV